jgi:hypothetical protein
MKRISVEVLRTACNWHEVVRLQTLRAMVDEQPHAERVGTVNWRSVMAAIDNELIDAPHTFRGTTFAQVP